MWKLIVFSLFVISCAPAKVDVKGIPEKIQLEHTINLQQLEQYYMALCQTELPTGTPEQLQSCTDTKMAELLTFIETGKVPTK